MVSRTCEDPYYGSLEYQHKAIRGQDKEIYSPNTSMLGERRTPPSTRFQHHQHRRSAPRHHHHPQPMRRPLSHQQRQLSSRSYYDEQPPQQTGPSLYPQMHPPHQQQHREWRSLHASFSHAQSLYYEGDDASFYGHDDDYHYSSSERHRDGRWSQQSQQYNERDHNEEEDAAAWAVAEEEAAREREYREQQETQQRLWKLQQQEEEQLRRYKEEHEARKAAEAEQERQKEQARQQERLQKEEEKRAHQNKIAELVRPAGIPKPPPPPPDLHLSQTQSANPHWATTATNTTPVPGSPSPTMSNKSLLAGEKEITIPKESDHCSEISRVSWDPPYPFFQASSSEHTRTTERKPLHLCKTPSQDDDSYYLEKKLSSNHSSSTRKLPPASLKSCADSYHSQRSTSISISCSRVGAFAEKPTPVLVEIQPGFSLPLRGSEETLQAVEAGRILNTDCLSCCAALVVKDDCDFVICPGCRVVSPVEGGFGTMECVGLGMRF